MTRSRTIVVTLVVVALVAVGAWVAYDQVLRGDSVGELILPSAPAATATPAAPSATADTGVAPSAGSGASDAPAATTDGVAGTWTVASGSQAGYRVRERLANLPAESDAVGRTGDVTGTITVTSDGTATTLTGGTITVDTTTIASDEGRRDNRLRNEGLETDRYPTATFTLTAPVEIPAAAVAGTASDVTLTGDLTLHGVTKSVQIPAQARLADGQIQVAGSITFPLSDFGIMAPNVGGFILSIADEGALEFLVVFDRA